MLSKFYEEYFYSYSWVETTQPRLNHFQSFYSYTCLTAELKWKGQLVYGPIKSSRGMSRVKSNLPWEKGEGGESYIKVTGVVVRNFEKW